MVPFSDAGLSGIFRLIHVDVAPYSPTLHGVEPSPKAGSRAGTLVLRICDGGAQCLPSVNLAVRGRTAGRGSAPFASRHDGGGFFPKVSFRKVLSKFVDLLWQSRRARNTSVILRGAR